MSFKIVRNDITKMNTEAIVNTANEYPAVGPGCDTAVYRAAGYEQLLAYRREKIGIVPEGEAFITPGFQLPARYIIHAVSPLFLDGSQGEEEKLRSCYRSSLRLAKENNIGSIAFPLISTGSFGYPKEEGLRIALDEINVFLLDNEMDVYLVVFDEKATSLGGKLYPDLEEYIDRNYVERKWIEEHSEDYPRASYNARPQPSYGASAPQKPAARRPRRHIMDFPVFRKEPTEDRPSPQDMHAPSMPEDEEAPSLPKDFDAGYADMMPSSDTMEDNELLASFGEQDESAIDKRLEHLSDTFSQYLLFLIQEKKMTNAEVYKRAIVDKKVFSKIKNDIHYRPNKLTAMCLCVGAKLNLDESNDLLARAGYAFSPCYIRDVIFKYFIEHEIYDMIELDIQLEEHGIPCIVY